VIIATAVLLVSISACSEDQRSVRGPGAGEVPETVTVTGTRITAGFYDGRSRKSIDVPGFEVSKHPITVQQYRQCVAAGACSVPGAASNACRPEPGHRSPVGDPVDGPTYALGDALPVTCTTPAQAEAYCRWQGGNLPNLDQWFSAARGPDPHKFAWGDTALNCDRHPNGEQSRHGPIVTFCSKGGSGFEVAKHPAGASSTGLEDVLLTRSELIRGYEGSSYGACSKDHCVIRGVLPGSIDSVLGIAENGSDAPPAGFRCALKEVQP